MEYLEEVWGREGPRYYTPRVLIGVRMTNSDDDDIQKICDECHNIEESIKEFAGTRGWDWEVVSAPSVLRPWGEGLPDDVDVHALNMRLLAASDAVAAHGFKGGSVSLGGLIEYADRQLLPLAIFHFELTRLSRKLNDRRTHSPLLRTYRFGDGLSDLYRRTVEWLDEFGELIQQGPTMRRQRDDSHERVIAPLRETWEAMSPKEQRIASARAATTPEAVELVLDTPGLFADLPTAAMGRLLDVLQPPGVLTAEELASWERWQGLSGVPLEVARLARNAAARERMEEVLRRDGEDLQHTGGWDRFFERYLRGEVGPTAG